jgi:hypothetical protein
VLQQDLAYSIPVSEINEAVEQGYFFMKIKIGQSGTQEEMLEKDKARLSEIHRAIGNVETSHTKNGKLPYYFDANGGYQKKETLLRLLDHTRKIGAFDQIALIEEPFPGLGIGLLETNGHQNYKKWQHMFSYHPYPNASWTKTKNGVFELDQDYYQKIKGTELYLNLSILYL